MRFWDYLVAAAIGVGLLTGGCTENDQSIYRTVDLSKGSTLVTDAKARTVLNLPPGSGSSPGYNAPSRIICAEPSPDVAQAVSKSFGAELSGAIASEGSGQAQIAAAQAASLAELGKRLAAVQALRDGLYRACEAYANGAMTDASYAAILSGYRTTLETTLFGDFLSSRGSTSALVSATSNASTNASTSETGGQQTNSSTSGGTSAGAQTPAANTAGGQAPASAAAGGQTPAANTGGGQGPAPTATVSGTTNTTTGATGTQGSQTGPSIPPDQVAKSLQGMHSAVLVHDLVDYHPIVAACVVAMDRRGLNGSPVADATPFAQFCREKILPNVADAMQRGDGVLEKILAAMTAPALPPK